MRQSYTRELQPEELAQERASMDEFEDATITERRTLNAYEANLAAKYNLPFVVKTVEIFIIQE
jgi:hypothetical protein